MAPRYTQLEVDEILRRALDRSVGVDGLEHHELIDVAREVGIDRDAVELAVRDIEAERALEAEREHIVATRKSRFFRALSTYAIVNSGLALIDWFQGPGWWVQYVLIGWGLGLAFLGRGAFFGDEERLNRQARRQLRRRRRMRERSRSRAARREFERAVEAGASALVEAASRKAAEHFDRMVVLLGGPKDFIANHGKHLAKAPIMNPVYADRAGSVSSIRTRDLGVAVIELGGGRRVAADKIDHRVGLSGLLGKGAAVDATTPLCMIHATDETGFARAAAMVKAAYAIGGAPPVSPRIHSRIGPS